MTPNKTSIKEFFQGDKQYTIPVYQRAYSWEEAQWSTFLEDLNEATKGDNHYFFGNVLLEKLSNDEPNDIIDGQQRITTIIIFARALCNILRDKIKEDTTIILSDEEDVNNEEFIKRIEEDYLIYRGKAKLQAVEYDRDYFKDFIIKGEAKHEPQTPSQTRIKEAKEFFEEALKKLDTKEILAIFKAMQKAEILSIPFTSKKDSVLMFELQNNRGKELTNMEKLKSYLAYQIYTYCDKEAENKLNEITKIFEEIYRLINDIQTNEDSVLRYFNISKFGFDYRENNDEKNYKKELKYIENSDNKIEWIDEYVNELKNAFVNFKEFEKCESIYREYLQYLKIWEVYPFIIKAYKLFRNDKNILEQVFKALEIIAFRHKLVQTRANLAARLNNILKDFDSVDSLIDGLRKIYANEPWYWGDNIIKNKLKNIFKENKGIIAYLFMRYEKHLRSENAQSRGYKFELKDIENRQIEHIAPQTETIKESGKDMASGYCEYDDEFNKGFYMNCIGNLLLIAGSHNASIGNEPFERKLESYEKSSLKQQREVKDFIVNAGIWDKEAIKKRREKLEQFVLDIWNLKYD